MTLDHIAIWTKNLEELREFYTKYFGGISNERYFNEKKQFASYFLSFKTGTRMEIMTRPDILARLDDSETLQHSGIVHMAFGVDTMREVDEKAKELDAAGFKILSGPRRTGDGGYEFETLDPDGNRIEVTTLYTEQ
jgi:lactoylglutathione lyase